MKNEDLKAKTPDELQKALMDARKTQMNLRFQRSGGQLENTAEIRKVRRQIARIKTFMNAKQQPAKAEGAAKAKTAAKPKAAKKPAKTSAKTEAA